MPHQCLKCGQLFNEGTTTILRGCPECRGTRFFYTQTPLTVSERDKLLATSEVSLREAIDQLMKQAQEGTLPDLSGASGEWIRLEAPPTPTEPAAAPAPAAPVATKFVSKEPAPIPLSGVEQLGRRGEASRLPGNRLLIKLNDLPRRRGRREVNFDYVPPEPPAPPVAPAPPRAEPVPEKLGVPEAFRAETESLQPLGEGPPETIRIGKPGEYEIDVKRLLEDNPIVIQRDGTYLIHLASLFDAAGKRRP